MAIPSTGMLGITYTDKDKVWVVSRHPCQLPVGPAWRKLIQETPTLSLTSWVGPGYYRVAARRFFSHRRLITPSENVYNPLALQTSFLTKHIFTGCHSWTLSSSLNIHDQLWPSLLTFPSKREILCKELDMNIPVSPVPGHCWACNNWTVTCLLSC